MNENINEVYNIRFVDAYAGIGGFRMGLEKYGHECVFTIDYDKNAKKAYESIWGDEGSKYWHDKIENLDPHDIPEFDLLVGGFPCAKFSMAGDRMGFDSDDPKARQFFELVRIVKARKPKYLFFENVKGLLNHDKGESFRTILRTLDELGYDVEWQCLNAKDFGYPVLRERVFIIGHLREGRTSKPIFPITEGIGQNGSEARVFQYRRGYFRVFQGYSPTLTASMGTGGNNVPYVIHGDSLRKMTPRELFRLQGISENHIESMVNSGLSHSALYERAGRTVFIPIIERIVERITQNMSSE